MNSKSANKKIGPLVTILVPSYNHSKYISKCIESIISQTYDNFELIVIDDGSIDDSVEILQDLKIKYNFTLILQENKGISYTINKCIKELANGDYFTFCASDDYWVRDKLSIQVEFMIKNRFYPMCFGKAYIVNSKGDIIEDKLGINNHNFENITFEDIFLLKIHPPVSYFFDIKIFDEIGLYDESVLVEDFYMNLKILSKYPIGFIDDELFFYRVYDEEFKIESYLKRSNSMEYVINKYKFHPLYKKALQNIHLHRFYHLSIFQSYKRTGLIYLLKSFYKVNNLIFLKGAFRWLFYYK
jgi:alpha-1,3-rhamnosyltransferase